MGKAEGRRRHAYYVPGKAASQFGESILPKSCRLTGQVRARKRRGGWSFFLAWSRFIQGQACLAMPLRRRKRRTRRRSSVWPIPTRAKTTSLASPRRNLPLSVRSQASRISHFSSLIICPAAWLVESKSFKLYLASFRNHGAFHEDCTLRIGKDFAACAEPRWLRIGGYWNPRGGIPIDVFWSMGELPAGLWVPEQSVPLYRGRG